MKRKHYDTFKNENYEMQYRNAISLPLFSRRKYSKTGRKARKDVKDTETGKVTTACKKFTKTIDDCKKYLKELHDSNKNLGLICSSSEISYESSIKNVWSDTQVNK